MKLWASLITSLVLISFGYTTQVRSANEEAQQQIQQQMEQSNETIRLLVLNECLKEHTAAECLKLVPPAPPAPEN